VAQWTLDDNAANPTVLSEISAAQNGTFQDPTGDPNTAAQSVAGVIGGAFDFDGVDDFVLTGYEGIAGSAARSVWFWVNGNTSQQNFPHLVTWGVAGSANPQQRFAIRAVNLNNGTWGARVEVNVGGLSGTVPILNNTWNNIVVTYDGTNAEIFVNGVSDVSGALTVNTTAIPGGFVTIGTTEGFAPVGFPSETNNYYQGLIDDVRVYDPEFSDPDSGAEQPSAGPPRCDRRRVVPPQSASWLVVATSVKVLLGSPGDGRPKAFPEPPRAPKKCWK